MLSDQDISVRRLTYRCCALSSLSAAIDARIHGDKKCYEENKRKWLWLSWAAAVMQDTPVDGIENGCTLLPFASDVADKADCLCRPAPCPAPDEDCAITPAFTVLEALAFADLPVSPPEDSAYYVISGNTLGVGSIATWDGAAYVYTSVPNGSIVWATVTNDYWINTGGGPGPYFPAPLLTNITPNLWWADQDPDITAQGRDIQLQALGPNGWYNVAPVTNESALPQQVNLTGLPVTSSNGIRWNYIVEDCSYPSGGGAFEPPIEPPVPCTIIPAWTVDQNADVSEETTLPSGTYLILTNNYSITNQWSEHVGEIVFPDGTFVQPPVGATIFNVQDSSYWFLFGSGWAPLFPPILVTQNIDGTAFIESAYPAATAENNRQVLITATSSGGSTFVLWSGFEQDLPVTVATSGAFPPMTAYYLVDGCPYAAPVTYEGIPDDYEQGIVCGDGPQYAFLWYNYLDLPAPSQFTFTSSSPLETVTVTFISGQLPNTNILIFDGPGTGGPQIGNVFGPMDLNSQGIIFISSGPSITVYFVSDPGPVQTTPIWMQVNCAFSSPPTGSVTSIDDCDNYEFSLDVDVTNVGEGATAIIEYIVDGGAPQQVTGVGVGVTQIGPFPYNSEVVVAIIDEDTPTNSVIIGVFTNEDGNCTNPCAPNVGYKVNQLGDLSELPVDPGLPNFGFFVISDNTGIGTWPIGSLLGWNDPGTGYEWVSVNYTPGIVVSDGVTFWVAGGLGTQPYNMFPTPILTPIGGTPNNWTIFIPDLAAFGITTNRPVSLQVRTGFGAWTTVWTGTEQQMIAPTPIPISESFTEARVVWNYDSCGLIGGVVIGNLPWDD